MSLPFSTAAFLDAFRRYNESVWPAQWLLVGLALAVLWLALAHTRERARVRSDRVAAALLAALWAWTAIAYHVGAFRAVTPAAWIFGGMFLAEAAMLAWIGAWRGRITFRRRSGARGLVGALIVFYALAGYPLLGSVLGHHYPAAPTFGVPCPTVIFTLGLLLWADSSAPRVLLVVPVLWAAIGTVAAVQLGMLEDLGLSVAAVAVLAHAWRSRRPRGRGRRTTVAGARAATA